jgi:hypothetical protein
MNIQLTAIALQMIARYEAKLAMTNHVNQQAVDRVFYVPIETATPAEMSHRIVGTYKLAGGSFMKCQLDYTRNQ